jgi:hypothetical protein
MIRAAEACQSFQRELTTATTTPGTAVQLPNRVAAQIEGPESKACVLLGGILEHPSW